MVFRRLHAHIFSWGFRKEAEPFITTKAFVQATLHPYIVSLTRPRQGVTFEPHLSDFTCFSHVSEITKGGFISSWTTKFLPIVHQLIKVPNQHPSFISINSNVSSTTIAFCTLWTPMSTWFPFAPKQSCASSPLYLTWYITVLFWYQL